MDHDQGPEDDHEQDHDSTVGYGKPPKHTRWKPGECPNPKGRPKKALGRKPILERIANELCQVRIGAGAVLKTRLEVLLTAVRNATANGNPAAQKIFDRLLNESQEEGPELPKAVLIVRERLSQEEWEVEYGYLGSVGGEPPPSRKRGLIPLVR